MEQKWLPLGEREGVGETPVDTLQMPWEGAVLGNTMCRSQLHMSELLLRRPPRPGTHPGADTGNNRTVPSKPGEAGSAAPLPLPSQQSACCVCLAREAAPLLITFLPVDAAGEGSRSSSPEFIHQLRSPLPRLSPLASCPPRAMGWV